MGKSLANLEGSNINETIALVNQAEENERTRRMSIPFGSSDEQETDLDLSLANSQLSTVHQELLHLFAIHDVSFSLCRNTSCYIPRLSLNETSTVIG